MSAHTLSRLQDFLEIRPVADIRAPKVGRDPVFETQTINIVGQYEAAGGNVAFNGGKVSSQPERLHHVGHDLHQSDGPLRTMRPGASMTLNQNNTQNKIRVQ